jgi:hypothetical protein
MNARGRALSGRDHLGHRLPAMRTHPSPDHPGLMELVPKPYAIRVVGHLDTSWLSAFPEVAPEQQGTQTVLTGSLDRSALLDVLAGIGALGLELVQFRQLAPEQLPQPRHRRSLGDHSLANRKG